MRSYPSATDVITAYELLGLEPGATTVADLNRAYKSVLKTNYGGTGGVGDWTRPLIEARGLVADHIANGIPALGTPLDEARGAALTIWRNGRRSAATAILAAQRFTDVEVVSVGERGILAARFLADCALELDRLTPRDAALVRQAARTAMIRSLCESATRASAAELLMEINLAGRGRVAGDGAPGVRFEEVGTTRIGRVDGRIIVQRARGPGLT